MADDDASKTEDPTAKKLSKARSEGQVAQSQEIKSWVLLMGSALLLFMLAPSIASDLRDLSRGFIEHPHAIPMDQEGLRSVFADVLIKGGLIMMPVFGLLFFLAIVANVGQMGFVYSPKKMAPKMSNLSLKKGFKKMFSMKSIVEFVKGMVKLSLVGIVAFGLTLPLLDDITLIPDMDLLDSLDRIHALAVQLVLGTVAVMTVIALLDFAYQKFTFIKEQKMTKQEVKDEHKQSEGDPQVKARIRQLRAQRARQRMMAAVPEADVVVTNPTHFAVALKYNMDEMPAPKLIAKGMDFIAFRIREMAEEHDIPIVENAPLARALYATVELDDEIPPEHYKAVAEVIGYVMRLRGELQGG
jgi:flagellar biosynthesis protein FlhB